MKKIKVLFLIPNLMHGGAERVLVNLVNHMDSDRFDITVQTMFDVGIYQDQLQDHIRYIGGFPYYFRGNTLVYKLFSPQRLYKKYIKDDYDIIVSYLEGPSARVVGGPEKSAAKRICWMHIQLETDDYVSQVFRSMEEAQLCYSRFDRLICVSEGVRETVAKRIRTQAPIEVIYNTVETDVIRARSAEPVTDVCFSDKEINLISVAKLMKSKGYDRLVRVQKRLREAGYPTHVYIVGKGEELASLEKEVQAAGLSDSFTFLGFKENPYQYVKMADLYVCSSWREGFSTAVTEALIVGTPVVSTNCSGARELLGEKNEYGIVTENDEDSLYAGVKEMLDGKLSYYKEKAALRGQKFSMQSTVRAVENMLEEVLRG